MLQLSSLEEYFSSQIVTYAHLAPNHHFVFVMGLFGRYTCRESTVHNGADKKGLFKQMS